MGPLKWAHLPPPWVLVLVAIAAFLWVRGLYARERGRVGWGPRLLLTGLRTAVVLGLVLVLGGPFRFEEEKTRERSHLVVLVDDSASMRVKDRYDAATTEALLAAAWPDPSARPASLDEVHRGELVRRVLAGPGESLLREWNERFVLHLFGFHSDWRSLGSTARSAGTPAPGDVDAEVDPVARIAEQVRGLGFEGGRTRLGAVLRNAANEFARRQDQHLAGVVLLSDGRDTSEGEPPVQVLTALGPLREDLRVTAVGLGNPASGRNLWVERVRARDVVLVRDQVSFETALRHTGFDGRGPVRVALEIVKVADADGQPIEPRPHPLERDEGRLAVARVDRLPPEAGKTPEEVRLMAPFNEAGTFRVTVRAQFEDEQDAREDAVPEDDASHHEIRVVDQRIKVLYVDFEPRYDWRFLSNFLTREPGAEVTGRVAEARSRYDVQCLLQRASPLFEQPHSPGTKPLRKFPTTRREIFEYDVIILGDVDWTLFADGGEKESREVLQVLADFVEQGGGLALQAGVDLRMPLGFLDTPLAPLLPVNAREGQGGDRHASDATDHAFRLELTEAGAHHPIFSVVPSPRRDGGMATVPEIAAIWRGDDDLSREWRWWWLYRAQDGLRPNAVDLARVHRGDLDAPGFLDRRGQPLPVFATMRYGNGWVFWSSLDTISRIRRERRDEIYGAFWEQVIRFLATYRLLGGNKRYKILTDKDEYFVGETATVTITALDETYEPLDAPWLDGLNLEQPDEAGGTQSVLLEGDARPVSLKEEGQPGTYRLDLPLRRKGLVRLWIDDRGVSSGRARNERAEKRFEVAFRAREDVLKVPDHETLREIVRLTNPGTHKAEVVGLEDLAEAVRGIESRPREKVLRRDERSQWDRSWVLLAIVALLTIEWLLRKRWQML
jgi:hypothetical protein